MLGQSCHYYATHEDRIFASDRNIPSNNNKYWVLLAKSLGLKKEQLNKVCQYAEFFGEVCKIKQGYF